MASILFCCEAWILNVIKVTSTFWRHLCKSQQKVLTSIDFDYIAPPVCSRSSSIQGRGVDVPETYFLIQFAWRVKCVSLREIVEVDVTPSLLQKHQRNMAMKTRGVNHFANFGSFSTVCESAGREITSNLSCHGIRDRVLWMGIRWLVLDTRC